LLLVDDSFEDFVLGFHIDICSQLTGSNDVPRGSSDLCGELTWVWRNTCSDAQNSIRSLIILEERLENVSIERRIVTNDHAVKDELILSITRLEALRLETTWDRA
jgi:hypothetical protein